MASGWTSTIFLKLSSITNQRVVIHYNCIGAFEVPDRRKIPEAVLAGKVDVVLVQNIALIDRERGMTQSYIDLLTEHKVKLL